MEERHINLVREQIGRGQLTLIHPRQLTIGYCKFRQPDGTTININVIKFKNL